MAQLVAGDPVPIDSDPMATEPTMGDDMFSLEPTQSDEIEAVCGDRNWVDPWVPLRRVRAGGDTGAYTC